MKTSITFRCLRLTILMALFAFAGGLMVSSPVYAQTELPALELVVQSVDGPSAEYRADTETTWHDLEEGKTLNQGDHVRTGEETTLKLEVPGISLLKVVPGTTMRLTQLNRTTEQRGLLTEEEVTVNEIDIETEEGKVTNSVRQREGVATEYDLSTPNAIAGVRGTSFQCGVNDFGRTECGVGEGEVQFSSRANPEQSVTLRPGQKSSIGPDQTGPSAPQALTEQEASEIQQINEESQRALSLPPFIEGVNLNGTAFDESIRLEYSEPTELTLAGEAGPAEPGASLVDLSITINGEPASVEGLADWSVTQTPEVPEDGTEMTAQINITATDSNGKTTTRELTVTLVNPEETGEAPSEIPPEDYEEGEVPVEVALVAGAPAGEIEYPFHTFKGDATSGGIMIEGTASGEATIEGVAYTLDGGQNWEMATGGENWSVPIPSQSSGEYTVDVVAWTVDGIIGEPVEIGPIDYEAVSYNQAIRATFTEQWDAFSNEDADGFIEQASRDFLFTDPVEGGEAEDLSRSEFKNFLEKQFSFMESLQVFYNINQIFGTPQGGELQLGTMQWKGFMEFDDEQTSAFQRFPFATRGQGTFKYQRDPDGSFKMLSMEDFRMVFFQGFNESFDGSDLVYGHRFGFRVPAGKVDNIGNGLIEQDCHDGNIIVAFDTGVDWSSNPDPASFLVNDGTTGYTGGNCGEIEAGGIYNTGKTSFSEVHQIDDISSNKYKSKVEIQEGSIYAVNIKQAFSEYNQTVLIEVLDLRDTDNDNIFEEVEIRTVSPGSQQAILEYNGVNPFDQ